MESLAPQSTAPAGSGARKRAPRILSVTDDEVRRNALRKLIQGLAPEARVDNDADAIDGLWSAARLPADLVLVDAALPHGAASALARHLARLVPQATVMVLDTPDSPRALPGALHWTDVVPACRRWLEQWQAAGHGTGSGALGACSAASQP